MLQRIQSLFLLLATVSSVVLFFVRIEFPSGSTVDGKSVLNVITVCYVSEYQPDTKEFVKKTLFVSALLNTLISLIPLIALFLYKNRMRQSLFCRLNILLGAGMIVYLLFTFERYGGAKQLIKDTTAHYLILILPALTVLFSYLANLFILKDERLVRSADRIR